MHNHELTLTELLDDPLTRAVMAADRVDPAALKATLSAVARTLQHNFAAYQQMNCAGWSDQRWLLTSLTDQERFSANDGRMAQANRICRMAASTGPRLELPFVRQVLE
jgi:hypothetical protein